MTVRDQLETLSAIVGIRILFAIGVNGVLKKPGKRGFLAIVPEAVAAPRSGVRMGSDV
jgi:hypothetical protein